MVNTLLSQSTQDKVRNLQNILVSELRDVAWATPPDALHITLLDWLAPLVDYGDDKEGVFEKIHFEYDAALAGILETIEPINVNFNGAIVSPSAIAIIADEESTQAFNDIRQKFLAKIDLLPNTKQPPNIVHSTIVRFVGEVALGDVKKVVDTLDIAFVEHVDSFQLVRETVLPMMDYSVIKRYPLK